MKTFESSDNLRRSQALLVAGRRSLWLAGPCDRSLAKLKGNRTHYRSTAKMVVAGKNEFRIGSGLIKRTVKIFPWDPGSNSFRATVVAKARRKQFWADSKSLTPSEIGSRYSCDLSSADSDL